MSPKSTMKYVNISYKVFSSAEKMDLGVSVTVSNMCVDTDRRAETG